jgi:quinoprotein glucose dehydrogenase
VRETVVISQRSGIITTAASLLFHAGEDRKVRAHDTETGKTLWTADLPAGARGGPAMYEVNGRQYLVVNATQGPAAGRGSVPAVSQRAYVAFALKQQ